MKTRTQGEIDRQIKELEIDKKNLPEFSLFGSPNHGSIDAQIGILKGEISLDDLPDGDWDENDADNQIYIKAQEAEEWLNCEIDDDLFDLREIQSK